jgi:hypothetical protein
MDANDIQRQNEARFALAREQIARADRLQALLGLQAALLAVAAVALLIAALLRGPPVVSGVALCLGGSALCALAAAGGAVGALLRMHQGRPASGVGGGRPAGLFFDLLGTVGVFATPADFGTAFRSALTEDLIGSALAELLRASQAARRQRTALRWAVGFLLLGFALLAGALILELLGA